jgi:hypothetical protein
VDAGALLDGVEPALGAPGDAAATTDTGAASLIALQKRALTKWPNLVGGRIPVDVQNLSVQGSVDISNTVTVTQAASVARGATPGSTDQALLTHALVDDPSSLLTAGQVDLVRQDRRGRLRVHAPEIFGRIAAAGDGERYGIRRLWGTAAQDATTALVDPYTGTAAVLDSSLATLILWIALHAADTAGTAQLGSRTVATSGTVTNRGPQYRHGTNGGFVYPYQAHGWAVIAAGPVELVLVTTGSAHAYSIGYAQVPNGAVNL